MAESVLVTRALTKQYGGTAALAQADITIEQGQIYGLVGRNGAGKTTLIRMITAQTAPTSGELSLFGAEGERALAKMRSRIGSMVETPSFYPYLTARQNLEYYRIQRGIPGRRTVDEALEQAGLADTGKKLFKHFSLGMKQRLGLALALMNRPDFLVLDEPINGLDPEGIVELRNLLLQLNRERKTTILISSHILTELANLATHFGFIDQGHMLEQCSAQALEERCRACLELRVDDPAKAARVLEQVLDIRDFEVLSGGIIRLYSHLDHPERITRALVESGAAVYGLDSRGANLEDYFLSLIGGVHHA
ncbi:ABC transporter ATP-binding protein [Pseudoflavonifractor sp. 524-17]|uniref:ABC transporter ATP-binding protein n=1 Tax=Pseudoflavonifractor sp. 524-17 TaxID=2304577 RepID=UPI0013794EEB|nr:ABC transporter ATP-binding protein [Pseudoflavonifractor sp. 524-17]NCE65419.1 ABC transporter ATP-binding protein [Pseudoflavonifractor sp. 524-17]